jgi:hypothetical protein
MSDLQELGRRVEEELLAAEERRLVEDNPQRRSIVEFQQRHEQYAMTAERLMNSIIRPRMHKTAEYFQHAQVAGRDEGGRDPLPASFEPYASVSNHGQV